LKNAEIFGLVLSGEGGSANGWRCCWEVLLVSLSCSLPLLRTHPPSLLVCCFFVFVEMGQYIRTAGGEPIFAWEAGWKEPLWYIPGFSCCNAIIGGLSPRSTTEWASSLRSQIHSWRFRGPLPQPWA
jgi:hypothetical protein